MIPKNFKIENVILDKNNQILTLVSVANDRLDFELEGDCCSSSFFDKDSVLDVKDLLGETLLSCELVETGNEWDEYENKTIHYALKLKTDKQLVTLMWRNESNGYYSGFVDVFINGQSLGFDFHGNAPLVVEEEK